MTAEDILQYSSILFQQANNKVDEDNKKNGWKSLLKKDDKGKILNDIDNYIAFLEHSDKYKNKLKYNEFKQEKEFDGREFSDFDLNIIYNDCERETSLSSHSKIDSALSEVFNNHRYNPILDYLNNLEWDGKERIKNLFIELLDADDTFLNQQMTQKWFIAAVKRIVEPGCKFDNIIVLQGEQGIGKSTICELISHHFFNTVSLSEIGSKDLIDKLNKTWIAIIDEMDTFNRKEMSTIKTFLSVSQESVRLAYGKNTSTFKRHCIFIGSTNDETFLRDSTSSVERRFWVIKCNKTKMDGKIRELLTKDYIDQLWAEAMYKYNEEPNQYLDIDATLQNDFANTMKEFKTYNNDIVIDYIKEILNKNYQLNSDGTFDSELDFYNQFTDNKIYDSQSDNINKIPMSSLSFVLKKFYNEERPAKYIALALSDEWEYKMIKYKGKPIRGLYRKNKINNTKSGEIIDGLPF